MKAIINNKVYDTDKCELLLTYESEILNTDKFEFIKYKTELFKTKKGTYLRYISNSLSIFYKNINELAILSSKEVENLLKRLNEVDLYQKEFGKLEEG